VTPQERKHFLQNPIRCFHGPEGPKVGFKAESKLESSRGATGDDALRLGFSGSMAQRVELLVLRHVEW